VPKKRETVTLKDIAIRTGFSVNTVSKALRGKEDISLKTRECIRKAAAEMGHVNNALAASLRLGYTNTIAVILGDIANPHFAILMKEIQVRAREHGYTSILFNTNEDSQMELDAIQTALNKNVDGIIICPSQKSPENLQYLQKTGVPFVLIGRHEADYPSVVCNDEAGGYLATKTLLDAGHRNILCLHGALYISSARERLAGFRRAFAELGLTPDENLVREVPVSAQGCASVLEALDAGGQTYSAIFAFSDLLAWDAWCYLQAQGKQVPRDCSIVGFDHIQSRLHLPLSLTSISSYKGQMSTSVVDLLVALIKNGEPTADTVLQTVIPTTLAEGDSIQSI